jgi:hypothetical protein
VTTFNFEYFNMPGRPFTAERIELWCGNLRNAQRVHWSDLDDLLNRIMGMNESWGGDKERETWKSWIHGVILTATAQRALAHRREGFIHLNDAPDGTEWMMYVNQIEPDKKAQDDAEAS